jgi:hypothetical protein
MKVLLTVYLLQSRSENSSQTLLFQDCTERVQLCRPPTKILFTAFISH